ncbi:hypothetical protein AAKU67_002496 [Oxalobacteraceae bacterium GrIS 2.11]
MPTSTNQQISLVNPATRELAIKMRSAYEPDDAH